ncbi:hypothetical protein A1OQ_04700 [Enterovibrio norvegicus FF-162]|uniref:DUF469 domain-containing protein n=2 Tax=Vibrionaceae TaxID=641 RepID=A0A1E5C4Y8_9GAMM|nr:50S ribosome-binding protein YggL [Enterovibrio norvegicus]OEE60584.1 hypothetical protein A1OK_11600 [Enterovibrio norvegicus FF-454]OEE80228.1 hypothetical protein A1OQ_04700 [Enterovibrio norvegicus FF-162]
MKKRRTKRLRKKLYMDEFAVFGFVVSLRLNTDNDQELSVFMESFAGFAESRELLVGGGGIQNIELVISSALRYGSATDLDIAAVKEWFSKRSEAEITDMGSLVDLHQIDSVE